MKTKHFNIGFCIFSNIKVLPDISQNDIKIHWKIVKSQKNIFEFSFNKKTGPDVAQPFWAGPDPAHILWAGLSQAAWAGLMFQPITK